MLSNLALLLSVSRDSPVAIGKVGATHSLQELLIVSDYNDLEVLLLLSLLYDLIEGAGKSLDIVAIKIGGRFIESNDLEFY